VKVWVTGAGGFVGKHVVAQAALAGHDVTALVRPRGPAQSGAWPGVRVVPLDLADAAAVTANVKSASPDVVIHLAWYARPQDYLVSPENVDSLATTLAFAKAAVFAGCRKMVGVGTCLEYANAPQPRSEDDPLDPKSLYARCKHGAHLVLSELFERQGANLTWARLFHMHGPGENPARLLPAVAKALQEGRPFALSPGEQVRDHLDVRDVASALVHLATSSTSGPYNVCSGKPVTLRAVVETVGVVVGRPDLLQFGQRPYLEGEVMNLAGVAARLLATGWQPTHGDLARSIGETIAVGRAAF
jgi:nucleoside-diphosphate-sugar epimerase